MSENIKKFIDSISGMLDISGNNIQVKAETKEAGTYSKQVSTDSAYNLGKSNTKVAHALKTELASI